MQRVDMTVPALRRGAGLERRKGMREVGLTIAVAEAVAVAESVAAEETPVAKVEGLGDGGHGQEDAQHLEHCDGGAEGEL